MNVFKKIALAIVLLGFTLGYSQLAISETGLNDYDGIVLMIQKVDTKKKIIVCGDTTFTYDRNTKVSNFEGEVLKVKDLKVGDYAKVGVNVAQRYISRPVLSALVVVSSDGE